MLHNNIHSLLLFTNRAVIHDKCYICHVTAVELQNKLGLVLIAQHDAR